MAIRSVATTDTLGTFRTTFNSHATDTGDLTSLGTTDKASLVAAINEINTTISSSGFTLRDSSSTTQLINSGNTLNVVGSSGIAAVVSATDTLTISLNNDISQNIYADLIGTQHNTTSGTHTNIVVTVASKTAAHIYQGTGSGNGYKLDGVEGPFIELKPGNTYRFDQADSTNSGHPLLFYYDPAKTTQFSTGVTTNGTPGSAGAYTQIVVADTTPHILYYQCSSHAHMGNRMGVNSQVLQGVSFVDSTGTAVSFATNAFAIAQAVALG
jgi:hypothetical protein